MPGQSSHSHRAKPVKACSSQVLPKPEHTVSQSCPVPAACIFTNVGRVKMQLGHGESIRQTSMSSTITLETLLLLVSLVSRPPKAPKQHFVHLMPAPTQKAHSPKISEQWSGSAAPWCNHHAWTASEFFPWWRCYTMNPWQDTPKGSFQGQSYYSLDFFLETHSWKENDQNFLNKNASGSPRCKHLERQVFVTSFPCVCRYVFILRLPTPTRRSEAVYGGLLLACCHAVQ